MASLGAQQVCPDPSIFNDRHRYYKEEGNKSVRWKTRRERKFKDLQGPLGRRDLGKRRKGRKEGLKETERANKWKEQLLGRKTQLAPLLFLVRPLSTRKWFAPGTVSLQGIKRKERRSIATAAVVVLRLLLPPSRMAYTFLDAVAATGQRISAFFQTLTIFLLDHTLRPAFSLFSGSLNIPLLEGPPPQQTAAGEEQQEQHPSTELDQSPQQPPQQHQLDVQSQNSVTTTTPAITSQSQSTDQSEDGFIADSNALPQPSFLSLTPDQANSSKLPDTEPDMVRTSSATATLAPEQQPLKKIPVPNVVPALPLVASAKENATLVKAGSAVAAPAADSDNNNLSGDLDRLSIATNAAAVAATGTADSSNRVTLQPLEIPHDNNTTPAVAVDGANDAEPRQLLRANVLHGHGPSTSVGWNIVDSLPRAPVVRSPAVPINHELSQTSQLKEGFTDSATQLEDDLETPEEAAERAMHAGFMREALDMVCYHAA